MPTQGNEPHMYYFTVYALKVDKRLASQRHSLAGRLHDQRQCHRQGRDHRVLQPVSSSGSFRRTSPVGQTCLESKP